MLSDEEDDNYDDGGCASGCASGGGGGGDGDDGADFAFFEDLNEGGGDDADVSGDGDGAGATGDEYGGHPYVETIETEVDAPDPTATASADAAHPRSRRKRRQSRDGGRKRRSHVNEEVVINDDDDDESDGYESDPTADADGVGGRFRNPNPDDGQFGDYERTGKTLHPIRNTTESRDVAYGTNCDGDRKYVVGARTQRLLDAQRVDREDMQRISGNDDGCDICRTLAYSREVPGKMHDKVSRILANELYARGDAHPQIRWSETVRRMVFEYKRDVYDVCRNQCAQARVPLYEWTELKLRRHFRECDVAQSRVIAEQLPWFEDMVEMTRKQGAFYERDSAHGVQYHINTELLKNSLLLAREHRHAAGEYVTSVRREKEARLPTLERQQAAMDQSTSRERLHSAREQRKAMQRRQNDTFNPNNI